MDTAVVPEQRVVGLSAAEATRRLPASVTDGDVTVLVDLAAGGPGTAVAGARRFPATWQAGRARGGGYVEVGALSKGAAVVEVALPRRATRNHAQVLRDLLEGRPPPEPMTAPARRTGPLVAAAAVLVVLVAGLPALRVLTAPQPVSVETAAARYRAAAPAPPPAPAPALAPAPAGEDPPSPQPAPAQVTAPREPTPVEDRPVDPRPPAEPSAEPPPVLPDPGVYRYATTGWEELSMPGSRRSFPEESAQTVTHVPCGFQVSWQPLEERADAFQLCVADGRAVLASVTTYRAFFGHAHEQHFGCDEVRAPAGAAWAVRCSDGAGTVMHVTTRSEGREVLDVAGQPVETLRMGMDSRLEGDTSGTRHARMWFKADGLPVRTEVTSDLRVQGPFGPVRYREEHSLHLAELEPHR